MEELKALLRHYRSVLGTGLLILGFLSLSIGLWLFFRTQTQTEPQLITVEIAGAVKKPGIYQLPASSRVADLIKKAGGFKNPDKEFVSEILNQARLLTDGEKIFVPPAKPASPTVAGATKNKASPEKAQFPININQASAQELEALPGIGPTYARRIIEYRQLHGPFRTKEQIKEVKGIGEKTYQKIKDLISL